MEKLMTSRNFIFIALCQYLFSRTAEYKLLSSNWYFNYVTDDGFQIESPCSYFKYGKYLRSNAFRKTSVELSIESRIDVWFSEIFI